MKIVPNKNALDEKKRVHLWLKTLAIPEFLCNLHPIWRTSLKCLIRRDARVVEEARLESV